MSIAPALPTVFTRADAARRGFSAAQIRWRVEFGRWVRLRRGVFCTRESATRIAADTRFRQLVQIAAAIAAHDGPCWASHLSARRLHRLPALHSDRDEVCLTVDPASGAFERLGGVRILPAAVPADHQTYVGAVPTLNGPRTVVDTLRTLALDDA
ncbi:MAG: type IV toxin-antitoxin system AbiEi family antitoxin domain-containing protein, partial [Nocardioidaceae bacterium]